MLLQVRSRQELHCQEVFFTFPTDIVDRDHARMVELRLRHRLATQPVRVEQAGRAVYRTVAATQDLDRHVSLQRRVERAVHDTHSPFTKPLLQQEMPEAFPRARGQLRTRNRLLARRPSLA